MHELRDSLEKEFAKLKVERNIWEDAWREVRQHVRTTRHRYPLNDRDVRTMNDRDPDTTLDLLDTTARKASKVLRSGLHEGMTSPSRPWFKLGLDEPGLDDRDDIALWLHGAERVIREMFRGSNVYAALQQGYGEVGDYGTHPMFVNRDFEDVIRCYSMEIGEYWLAADERGLPKTCYRRVSMTVDQVVREFGLENVSQTLRNSYDQSNYHTVLNVVRAVRPRRDRDPGKADIANMPVMVAAWEEASNKDDILGVGGAQEGVLNVARWETAGYEPYGTVCPGLDALADTRQLQYYALRKAEAIDQALRPAMMAPASLYASEKEFFPGGVTYVDDVTLQRGGLRPIFEARFDMKPMLEDTHEQRLRVDSDYHVDLFRMFTDLDRRLITAEEIIRRHEEKMIMLGPVLDLLGRERLQPLISRAFNIAHEGGLIEDAPEDIQGHRLQVEYISTLAQALRAIGVGPIERTIGFIGTLAELDQSALHRLDVDESIDEFTNLIGAPPAMVRSRDAANELRQEEADAAAQAQMMQQVQSGAQSAKLISEASERGAGAIQRAGLG